MVTAQKKSDLIARYGRSLLIISIGFNIILLLQILAPNFRLLQQSKTVTKVDKQKENLFDDINPVKGFELPVAYGDLGPKMIELGVLDLEKFKSNYERSGSSLTKEELGILTKGSNRKIRITRENSSFLLNFFWAAGLGNKSKILSDGDMTKYGADQVGNFASTGGWTLSRDRAMNYYSKGDLITLTADQEALVEKAAKNIYRPCCNNPTSFPDCNHGMALLSVLQLLASGGVNEKEMYEAAKYINAFWFPGNYYDLALYFKDRDGKKFKDVPGEIVLGKDYSSASGWSKIKKELTQKGLIEAPQGGGASCGV